jgi:hypothetical protein
VGGAAKRDFKAFFQRQKSPTYSTVYKKYIKEISENLIEHNCRVL